MYFLVSVNPDGPTTDSDNPQLVHGQKITQGKPTILETVVEIPGNQVMKEGKFVLFFN